MSRDIHEHNAQRWKDEAENPAWSGGTGGTKPGLAAPAPGSWPIRIPLDTAATPPVFPIDALAPTAAREFVEALAVTFSMPIDVPALAWLALAGGCAMYRGIRGVQIDPDWREQLNLFVLVAITSGAKKSAVFNQLIEPVRVFERDAAEAAAPEVARAKTEVEIKRKTLAKLQALAADDPSAAAEAGKLAEELASTPEPVAPRLLVDDVTPEVLVRLLAQHNGKMIAASAECDLLGLFAGRYSDKSGANLGVFLKAHPGDEIIVDRIGRPPERIPSPALSVMICGQPDALWKMLTDRTLKDRGMIGRFLYAIPPSPLGSRPIITPQIPPEVREAYRGMMSRLLQPHFVPPVPPEWDDGKYVGGTGGTVDVSEDVILAFTLEARDALLPFREQVERTMAEGGIFHHHPSWASKLSGAAARIAGILTVAADPSRLTVGVEEAQAAVLIGRWAMEHARIAFQCSGNDPDVELAKRLLAWLERKRPKTFTRREAFQALKGGGGTVQKMADIRGALSVLVDHGHVVPADIPEHDGRAVTRGGAAVYLVHPEIAENVGR